MARVAFSRQGMEIFSANVSGQHMMGDPLPTTLVEAAQKAWAQNMGRGDDTSYIQPGSTWETVRVGPQAFSYKQFLTALKSFDPAGAIPQATTVKLDNTPKIIPAKEAPEAWSLAADIMLPRATPTKPDWQEPGPVMTKGGEVDWQTTQEQNLQRDLAKLGAKPRPPKPDGF